ncbi:queuosine precursor transporter [Sediminivirga luteola]|uniref:queuosine precursor transporter n=1 Tax=Sediminivirga luteola TaxID=1774748 RepID=UPI001F55CBD9|nr:queuosine precursor transporter [Sediminivirga luteola]MCI2267019.1 queuosine precursor transporter [Sediminivirga luteola]
MTSADPASGQGSASPAGPADTSETTRHHDAAPGPPGERGNPGSTGSRAAAGTTATATATDRPAPAGSPAGAPVAGTGADARRPSAGEALFASSQGRFYAILMTLLVAFFLISNISATKVISFGPIVTDGGAFLFPLAYIAGGVISEIYGFAAARKAILVGFGVQIVAALTFYAVMIAPPGPGYEHQAAFEAVLGFYPRILLASVAGFLVGQLLNSFIIVRIKRRFGERHLWARLSGSTVAGQFLDTLIFCTVAFAGIIPGADFISYVLFGFVYKCAVEFLLLPVTYAVVNTLKRHEPTYRQHG